MWRAVKRMISGMREKFSTTKKIPFLNILHVQDSQTSVFSVFHPFFKKIYHIQYPNICLWSHKTASKYSVIDSSQMSRNQTDISPSYRLYFLVFLLLKSKRCVFWFCLHFDACGHHFRLHIAAARWTCNSVERGQQRSTFPPGGSPLQRLAKVTVRWSDVWQLIFFFFFYQPQMMGLAAGCWEAG